MAGIDERYESELQRAILQAQRRIRDVYEQAILEIALKSSTVPLRDKPFSLSLYPLINEIIESKVSEMHRSLYREIVRSVERSWGLSNRKNDEFVDKRLKGRIPDSGLRQVFYDPNEKALEQFLGRVEKGMDLSKRVWKTLEPFKREMEQSLGLMLSEGKPAAKMATELKKFLNEPDKLFRRVRGEDGKLRLSKKAREYKPGQGVYRSSYKNALRLSRSENNAAYRSSDYERWQKLPFVIGVEVKLSKNHPHYDICDRLVGKYPKDYKHVGFHPQCICYSVPIMAGKEEMDAMRAAIDRGETPQPAKGIEAPHDGFAKWVRENEERVNGWASKPYWWSDNNKYVKAALNKK